MSNKISMINVAKYYEGYPHQNEALRFLDKYLDEDLLQEFIEIWRKEPDPVSKDPQQLTKNFHLSELIFSQSARRHGISNIPPTEVINNLRSLSVNVLQPLRDHFGKPVTITSGYRSPILNRKIKGSSTSQHMKGEAADLIIPGVEHNVVAKYILKHLPFDQLILEFWTPGSSAGWVHVSYKKNGKNRKQSLSFSGRKYESWN